MSESECSAEYIKLPAGWDQRFDQKTGNSYYINHITKAMQFEDPRIRYKQLQNERCSTESIPMQPLHGSPYHVYPASNFPAVKAFQGPNSSLQSVSASPLLSIRGQMQMEMSPILKQSSPQIPRMGNLARRQTIQETSFSNNIDTDAVVSKINNMFPTASDDHIRLLLKKYYNREAVVISALQVEKNPITMPGPFATPPSQRHLFHSNSAFQMTPPSRRFEAISRTDSPIPGRPSSVMSGLYGSPIIRNSPKPHSSPKMKLRYLKTIFPKADETLLLDILANSDNNVQKASETLIAMGYQKRDMMPPKISNRKENQNNEEHIIPLHSNKALTQEEKNEMKVRLQQQYKNIAERIIIMALESVNYSEDRALQILQIVQQEDETKAKKEIHDDNLGKLDATIPEESQPPSESSTKPEFTTQKTSGPSSYSQPSSSQAGTTTSFITSSESHYNLRIKESGELAHLSSTASKSSPKDGLQKSRFRNKRDSLKNSPKESNEIEIHTNKKPEFKSIIGRIETKGHNSDLSKGPDDTLLLADYVTWNGANPDASIGHKNIDIGHDANLLTERNFSARGRNAELCKGPNTNLAKGSIYSRLNNNLATNVKCN